MFTTSVVHQPVTYATVAVTNCFHHKSWLLPVVEIDTFLLMNNPLILKNNLLLLCRLKLLVATRKHDWKRRVHELTLVYVDCCYGYISQCRKNHFLCQSFRTVTRQYFGEVASFCFRFCFFGNQEKTIFQGQGKVRELCKLRSRKIFDVC